MAIKQFGCEVRAIFLGHSGAAIIYDRAHYLNSLVGNKSADDGVKFKVQGRL